MDELSLSSAQIPGLKAAINTLSYHRCTDLLESSINCITADEVRNLLVCDIEEQRFEIIDEQLIITDSESLTREEAIKEAIDLLFATGRTTRPELIEQEVWDREAIYSTSMGFGFAIPHCKSSFVVANSICLMKFKADISWDKEDSNPVKIMILLVVKKQEEANAHMQIFSRLAAKIMHEEFREFLLNNDDTEMILKFLKEGLGINELQ